MESSPYPLTRWQDHRADERKPSKGPWKQPAPPPPMPDVVWSTYLAVCPPEGEAVDLSSATSLPLTRNPGDLPLGGETYPTERGPREHPSTATGRWMGLMRKAGKSRAVLQFFFSAIISATTVPAPGSTSQKVGWVVPEEEEVRAVDTSRDRAARSVLLRIPDDCLRNTTEDGEQVEGSQEQRRFPSRTVMVGVSPTSWMMFPHTSIFNHTIAALADVGGWSSALRLYEALVQWEKANFHTHLTVLRMFLSPPVILSGEELGSVPIDEALHTHALQETKGEEETRPQPYTLENLCLCHIALRRCYGALLFSGDGDTPVIPAKSDSSLLRTPACVSSSLAASQKWHRVGGIALEERLALWTLSMACEEVNTAHPISFQSSAEEAVSDDEGTLESKTASIASEDSRRESITNLSGATSTLIETNMTNITDTLYTVLLRLVRLMCSNPRIPAIGLPLKCSNIMHDTDADIAKLIHKLVDVLEKELQCSGRRERSHQEDDEENETRVTPGLESHVVAVPAHVHVLCLTTAMLVRYAAEHTERRQNSEETQPVDTPSLTEVDPCETFVEGVESTLVLPLFHHIVPMLRHFIGGSQARLDEMIDLLLGYFKRIHYSDKTAATRKKGKDNFLSFMQMFISGGVKTNASHHATPTASLGPHQRGILEAAVTLMQSSKPKTVEQETCIWKLWYHVISTLAVRHQDTQQRELQITHAATLIVSSGCDAIHALPFLSPTRR